MFDMPLTLIDVETTGGSPFASRVIEIGLLRVEHGEVVGRFETLLNPGTPIPEFITKLTGISDRDVITAPMFDEIKEELLPYFEGSHFVAHNVNFDYSFITSEFNRSGFGFRAPRMCTVRLSRALYPQEKRHNLSAIIERFDFMCENRHRAMGDTLVMWDFLRLVNQQFSPETLEQAVKLASGATKKTLKNEAELSYDYDPSEDLT